MSKLILTSNGMLSPRAMPAIACCAASLIISPSRSKPDASFAGIVDSALTIRRSSRCGISPCPATTCWGLRPWTGQSSHTAPRTASRSVGQVGVAFQQQHEVVGMAHRPIGQ
jgi:hypothetical protein